VQSRCRDTEVIVQVIGDCSGAEQVHSWCRVAEVMQNRCRAHAEVQMKPQRCSGAEVQWCAVVQWCSGAEAQRWRYGGEEVRGSEVIMEVLGRCRC